MDKYKLKTGDMVRYSYSPGCGDYYDEVVEVTEDYIKIKDGTLFYTEKRMGHFGTAHLLTKVIDISIKYIAYVSRFYPVYPREFYIKKEKTENDVYYDTLECAKISYNNLCTDNDEYKFLEKIIYKDGKKVGSELLETTFNTGECQCKRAENNVKKLKKLIGRKLDVGDIICIFDDEDREIIVNENKNDSCYIAYVNCEERSELYIFDVDESDIITNVWWY